MSDRHAIPADTGVGYKHCGARVGSARWCDICDGDQTDRVGAMRWYPDPTDTARAVQRAHWTVVELAARAQEAAAVAGGE